MHHSSSSLEKQARWQWHRHLLTTLQWSWRSQWISPYYGGVGAYGKWIPYCWKTRDARRSYDKNGKAGNGRSGTTPNRPCGEEGSLKTASFSDRRNQRAVETSGEWKITNTNACTTCCNPHGDVLPVLNRFKAKILKLHSDILKTVMLDTKENDEFEEEIPTVFHILQMQKRRTRSIRSAQDAYGHIQKV